MTLVNESTTSEDQKCEWRPLLLLVPLRLGLTSINRCYLPAIENFFKLESCVGIIGGRPNHALYFIGIAGEKLVYLDPHYCRPSIIEKYGHTRWLEEGFESLEVDPSLALAFFCESADSFERLSRDLRKVCLR
ncbi:peptidase family C54, partial [Oesophagostomum dentatum]